MNLPIQSAPIDRASRAASMHAGARGGVAPSDLKSIACPLCAAIPNPIASAICSAIFCGGGLGGLFNG